ncbi:MAG: S41 family peptidase [Oscillospiraceae bacterium]|nr:S41 family peptidase [Oscillospiraceae bacterium]
MKKPLKNNRALVGLLCFLAGLLAAFAAILLGFGGWEGFRASAKYASVIRVIETHYVADYDVDELTDAALAAVIDALDDDWSYYMDADTYAAYQDYSANQYQGIGVTISQDEETGGFLIVTVTKDGPAQTAGLEPGDIILAVDGTDVTGGTTADVRALIQADYGAKALLTVQDGEDGSVYEVSVSCEVIYTSPVTAELLDGNVGYIIISNFREGAGSQTIEAIEELIAQGAESLIFDVRSNPGGQVSEMVELLDYLLPEGDLFIRTDKNGREVIETSDADCVELPMAVIVNADSYSAAEFFAAALRDYDWATIVGEATTGKGRSQVTISLADGSAVHISKYTYLTPSRTDLYEAGGLVPDVVVGLTEEELTLYQTGWLEPEDDPQVQAAIDALAA